MIDTEHFHILFTNILIVRDVDFYPKVGPLPDLTYLVIQTGDGTTKDVPPQMKLVGLTDNTANETFASMDFYGSGENGIDLIKGSAFEANKLDPWIDGVSRNSELILRLGLGNQPLLENGAVPVVCRPTGVGLYRRNPTMPFEIGDKAGLYIKNVNERPDANYCRFRVNSNGVGYIATTGTKFTLQKGIEFANTDGGTKDLLDYYDSMLLTTNLDGAVSAIAIEFRYVRIGKTVWVFIPYISEAQIAADIIITTVALPEYIRPTSQVKSFILANDTSTLLHNIIIDVDGIITITGGMTFYDTFSGAGTATIYGGVVQYYI